MMKLKPWSHPMFVASSFSIMNYDADFWELLRNGTVKVFIEDIDSLSDHIVHLSDGTMLPSDVLCCATGWKKVGSLKFLPNGIEAELGIPHPPSPHRFPTDNLVEKADKEILKEFPRLRNPPILNKDFIPATETKGISSKDRISTLTPMTPFTLHRFMVPPSPTQLRLHRDIAFAGVVQSFSVSCMAHIQGIWVDAYLNNQLPSLQGLDSEEQMQELQYKTVLYSRFGKWRYPAGYGDQVPDMVFDAVPYMDLMLADLGLERWRKGGALAEITSPYGPEDYKDLVAEWATRGGRS
jgi:hypothetical protein